VAQVALPDILGLGVGAISTKQSKQLTELQKLFKAEPKLQAAIYFVNKSSRLNSG